MVLYLVVTFKLECELKSSSVHLRKRLFVGCGFDPPVYVALIGGGALPAVVAVLLAALGWCLEAVTVPLR